MGHVVLAANCKVVVIEIFGKSSLVCNLNTSKCEVKMSPVTEIVHELMKILANDKEMVEVDTFWYKAFISWAFQLYRHFVEAAWPIDE